MSEANTPDFMEPLTGARFWLIDSCLQLHSMVFNQVLWPTHLHLTAKNEGPQSGTHGVGIYSYKDMDCLTRDNEVDGVNRWLLQRYGHSLRLMGGEVYSWGTVVEHEDGWRAEFAYPKAFVCVHDIYGGIAATIEETQLVARQFGVPVASEETHETWKAAAYRHSGTPYEPGAIIASARYYYKPYFTFSPPGRK